MNPSVHVLEKAEELELPAEVIEPIQTLFQLLGNASSHNITTCKNSLLMQMNPCLKALLRDKDFKESAPMFFGENFGSLAGERRTSLNKDPEYDKPHLDFHKGHSQKQKGHGGGSHYSGHYKQRGWQPSNSKTAQKL